MRKLAGLAISIIALAAGAAAQSNVTTTNGGTAGTVPVFTTGSNIENSPITVSGSNVGIGTTSPDQTLTVQGNVHAVPAQGWSGTNTVFNYLGDTSNGISSQFGGYTTVFGYNGIQLVQQGKTALTVSSAGIVFPDGTTQNTAWTGTANLSLPNGLTVNSTTAGQITEWLKGASGGNADLVLQSSGGSGPAFWLTATPTLLEIGGNGGSEPTQGSVNVSAQGNVGIGTTSPGAKLEVDGSVRLTSGSGASITFADGTTQSTAWTGTVCGGDYAEAMKARGEKARYEPGDVLVLASDGNSDVEISAEPYSTMVAGIYATRPGVVGRRAELAKSTNTIPMAMVGVVPTKVSAENGPIRRGDLLVSSSTYGYAMKGTDRSRLVGAVIGKAMGSLSSGKGTIEVLVTLQ